MFFWHRLWLYSFALNQCHVPHRQRVERRNYRSAPRLNTTRPFALRPKITHCSHTSPGCIHQSKSRPYVVLIVYAQAHNNIESNMGPYVALFLHVFFCISVVSTYGCTGNTLFACWASVVLHGHYAVDPAYAIWKLHCAQHKSNANAHLISIAGLNKNILCIAILKLGICD